MYTGLDDLLLIADRHSPTSALPLTMLGYDVPLHDLWHLCVERELDLIRFLDVRDPLLFLQSSILSPQDAGTMSWEGPEFG